MPSPIADVFQQFIGNLPSYVVAIVVFAATLLLANGAKRWIKKSIEHRVEDPETQELMARIGRWTVLLLGTLTALNQIPGINVSSLLTGLGVLGFTIGFALQDIARNFIAGLLLLMRQPFSVGDAVEIAGHDGTVMDITTRDTVIKTWDGVMEIIPNLDVYTNPIVNYSQLPLRRRTVMIGLGYGEDVDRARDLFLNAIRSTEGVAAEPAPQILSEELGDSALTIAARFWVNQETDNLLVVHSEVVEAINRIAEQEEIDLPYPTQFVQLGAELPTEAPFTRDEASRRLNERC
ncbi:MAG: mechanosensitive ion channel family protein [Anaerolineae bacterium]|jgi:small-conductance mechanosensitive channel